MLHKIKQKCWKNIKKPENSRRFQCLKNYLTEGGANAEPVVEKKVREWVDSKNRGKKLDGVCVNGLAIPSLGAHLFFCRLDTIIQTFEGKKCLTGSLSKEAMLSKVYDDVKILDLWNNITPELEDKD